MADKKVYTEEEKKTILARADEIGVRKAAEEAGAAWQAVARWKKAATDAVATTVENVEKAAEEVKTDVEKVEKKTRTRAKKAADDVKKTTSRAKKTADKAAKDEAAKVEKTVKSGAKKAKTTAEKIKDEVKAVEKKTEETVKKATRGKRMITTITIQSPLGGEITPEDIRAKVGDVDHIYVRVDQNKAYWVKGDETGSVDLW